jgi:streptogramin lyase
MENGPNGGNKPLAVSTGLFDSNGDLWLTGFWEGIRKWDRSKDEILRWEVPLYRGAPYGLTIDSKDRVWLAEAGTDGVGVFDPKTENFRHYQLVTDHPLAYQFRRVGVDSKDIVWAATWASYAAQNSKLYRLDPVTAEVEGWKIPIEYANPYDTAADHLDNIWIATSNHVVKFDQNTKRFTLYPVTTRTDIPRLTITKEGAIWFTPRNAGETGGYGAVASVLYPDKDKITTLKAFYHPQSYFGRHLTQYKGGVVVKPEGKVKLVNSEPQNPGAYARTLEAMGLAPGAEQAPVSPYGRE